MASAPPAFKPFTLALIQLGQTGEDKTANLKHAREMILKAAAGTDSGSRPSLVVLPEIFNSPYGVTYFPKYAETIGYTPGKPYNVEEAESESIKMLSAAAKEAGVWLLGGSIPERDAEGKLYNTCTVYSPKGELIAMHRKMHLFDIDIPGQITFKAKFARIGLGICYDVRFPELAAISARQGCHMCIYPGAFNMTTGPLHWELLQRARAVDNQIFFAMCSPARSLAANYHAVSALLLSDVKSLIVHTQWGHSMVIDPM
ncbi:hypothetical protein EIP86_007696 [Pleurotus ostreatoroseus]|nr:hypothetical protein EIP86_007696 [Pleurotus ostreatoroseus]